MIILQEHEFCPDQVREELENKSGLIRMKTDKNFADIEESGQWFLDLCKQIGTPVSQSAEGDLLLSIKNESFDKNDPRTRGPNTNRKLGFHTDRCDVIAFFCIMPAKLGGENQIVKSQEIYACIKNERPELLKILQNKFPYKRHVVDKGNANHYVMQPIFSEKDGYFACSYLRVLIDRADKDENCPNLTSIQREALDFLDIVCERTDFQQRLTMQKGEILMLNNWTLLHRRTEFEDFTEKSKRRHLLRVWLSMPNSRPIDDAFIENYGSTKSGAIRGGMKPSFER